ncbi:MAG TPA: ISNCY family transposase [Chitinophagaceae bacterium]
MRQRFKQQLSLGTVPIGDIKIPTKSRDEMPPTVRALQYIFTTEALNEKVFKLLEEKICKGKKKTGRKGMDLWHILVLAVIRHATGTNWDRLHMMANYDLMVRSIMGVHSTRFGMGEIEFEYQNILDNVSLIDEDLLYQVNAVVVEAGHQLLKKKEREVLELALKTDSYAVETNIHFPTDLNLLWDSCRKCLDTIERLQEITPIKGWRKIKHIRKTLKSQFRRTSHQVFRGKTEHPKKQSVQQYLQLAEALKLKCEVLLETPPVSADKETMTVILLVGLRQYVAYVIKFTDQIERRLLKGEIIPAEEKVYSIFEPHTEWITKGKQNKKVELGHLLLITTDQYQLIIDYKIMKGEKDASQVKPLMERLAQKCDGKKISSHSFDKGFWSKDNHEILSAAAIEQAVLPKRGKHNKEDKERESSKSFKQIRNQHSAVESNINMLEHHGLNRCMDKGLGGFKRCVGLSILAYNLHTLGNALQAIDRKKEEQSEKRKQRYRQAA